MSSENTTFFITRHFDKITTIKNGQHSKCFTNIEIDLFNNKFIKDKNIYLNPFICDNTYDRVEQIYETLDGYKIDMIFCSPFLRCIQTALDIVNFTKNNKYINIIDKTIYIDFGLSAIFKEFKLPSTMTQPKNIFINDIYNFSTHFIDNYDNKRKKYLFTKIELFDDTFKKLNFSENFSERFYNTFVRLQNIFKNKHILIITHGASLTHWFGGKIETLYKNIEFKYSYIYKINNLLSKPFLLNNIDNNDSFNIKYFKNNSKHNMKIALLLLTIENPYFTDNLKNFINDNVKLYIHAKFPDKIDPFFKKYLIKNQIDTKWGDMSLVNASINLLEESFYDCDYFYLFSGDTYIINQPEIFDLSCFDLMKEYNGIYKTSQWWGLNKKDAKTIIDTRNKYKNYFTDIKLNGAYDENYFLTVLNKEINDYKYNLKRVMYVKWLDNVITKHPIIFNKPTECDIYLSRNSFFIRKCLKTFENKKVSTKEKLHIFYIGSETNQKEILKMNLINIDYAFITSIEIDNIEKTILNNTFYIFPIIWKFYEDTKKSLQKDIILSSWDKVIFYPEKFKKI